MQITWKEAISSALKLLMQNKNNLQLREGFNASQILDTIKQHNIRKVTGNTPKQTISKELSTNIDDCNSVGETPMFARAPGGNGYLLSNQSFKFMYNDKLSVSGSPEHAASASSAPVVQDLVKNIGLLK